MVAAVPCLVLTYGSDTTLFGFTSTSQQFFMLGSGANANLEALGGSEADAQTIWPSGSCCGAVSRQPLQVHQL